MFYFSQCHPATAGNPPWLCCYLWFINTIPKHGAHISFRKLNYKEWVLQIKGLLGAWFLPSKEGGGGAIPFDSSFGLRLTYVEKKHKTLTMSGVWSLVWPEETLGRIGFTMRGWCVLRAIIVYCGKVGKVSRFMTHRNVFWSDEETVLVGRRNWYCTLASKIKRDNSI